MGYKKIAQKILVKLVVYGLHRLFDYIDSDKSGNLSKKELTDFVKEVRKYATRITRK